MRGKKATADPLAISFRHEAEEDSPQFSQQLHERIMRGVSSATTPAAARREALWRWPIAAVFAAAIALMFLLHDRHGRLLPLPPSPPSPSNVVADAFPPLPEIGPAVATISDPAVQQINSARYAYLDQDAQRFTHFMIDQIDVLPTQR
jgi:hypothetical protein